MCAMPIGQQKGLPFLPLAGVVLFLGLYLLYEQRFTLWGLFVDFVHPHLDDFAGLGLVLVDRVDMRDAEWLTKQTISGELGVSPHEAFNILGNWPILPWWLQLAEKVGDYFRLGLSFLCFLAVTAPKRFHLHILCAGWSCVVVTYFCSSLFLSGYVYIHHLYLGFSPELARCIQYRDGASMIDKNMAFPGSFWLKMMMNFLVVFGIYFPVVDVFWSYSLVVMAGGSGWDLMAAYELPGYERFRAQWKKAGLFGTGIGRRWVPRRPKPEYDAGGGELDTKEARRIAAIKEKERDDLMRQLQRQRLEKQALEAAQEADYQQLLRTVE